MSARALTATRLNPITQLKRTGAYRHAPKPFTPNGALTATRTSLAPDLLRGLNHQTKLGALRFDSDIVAMHGA
ncbi:MAG: hypothetical protein RI906_770 [Pseudomonadota bacterium]